MGNFMIPVCCVCGIKSPHWHSKEWEDAGGLQDFCPEHVFLISKEHGAFEEYVVNQHQRNPCETSMP